VLILPSAAGVAPRIDAPMAEHEAVRARVIGITCIASLGGQLEQAARGGQVERHAIGRLVPLRQPDQRLRVACGGPRAIVAEIVGAEVCRYGQAKEARGERRHAAGRPNGIANRSSAGRNPADHQRGQLLDLNPSRHHGSA
jgi:hypothetical protein